MNQVVCEKKILLKRWKKMLNDESKCMRLLQSIKKLLKNGNFKNYLFQKQIIILKFHLDLKIRREALGQKI